MPSGAVRGRKTDRDSADVPVSAPSGSEDSTPPAAPAAGRSGRGQRRSASLLVAGAPALLTLVCGLVGLGDRQLWRDEHATWWATTQLTIPELVALLRNVDIVFAPYYGYLRIWTAVFGDSAFALRFPSLLWMSVAAALLALLGRRLYDAPTGLVAGLLFAVLPTVSRYAAEARPYAQTVAVTIGATLLLLRAVDRPGRWRWAGYALGVAAVGLSHLVALAVLAAHAVLLLAEVRAHERRTVLRLFRSWLVAAAAGCVVVAPLVYQAGQQRHQIDWIPRPEPLDLLRLPGALLGGREVATVLGCLALAGLAVSRWPGLALAAWALPAPVTAYLVSDQMQIFYPRYLLFTMPAWVLLAAAGTLFVARLGTPATAPLRRPVLRSVLAGAVAVAVAVGFGLPEHRAVRHDLVEDEYAFRQVAIFIRAEARPGDGIAYSGYRYLRRAIAYELRHHPRPIDVFLAVPARERGWYHDRECPRSAECLGDVQRIWLVTVRGGANPLDREPGARGQLLRDRFTVARVAEFPRIRVLELVRKR
ncbi:glycosyltransferase family 39 protein [Micromonospora sp. HM5-17]|uniref:glycosyltransferase family 39 protein n=1 Tax=Micromonospora sp. HM5-17 TaxID=2487710 RepID=UPI000F4970DA|nr:glycosyltransferase family 39 protein [Micromonospora sp. HM5-17]ROT27987.1 hypothetical protein EF879_22380 [Micromonospora sp. HM5-17]